MTGPLLPVVSQPVPGSVREDRIWVWGRGRAKGDKGWNGEGSMVEGKWSVVRGGGWGERERGEEGEDEGLGGWKGGVDGGEMGGGEGDERRRGKE